VTGTSTVTVTAPAAAGIGAVPAPTIIGTSPGLTQALYTAPKATPTAQTGPSYTITPDGANAPAIVTTFSLLAGPGNALLDAVAADGTGTLLAPLIASAGDRNTGAPAFSGVGIIPAPAVVGIENPGITQALYTAKRPVAAAQAGPAYTITPDGPSASAIVTALVMYTVSADVLIAADPANGTGALPIPFLGPPGFVFAAPMSAVGALSITPLLNWTATPGPAAGAGVMRAPTVTGGGPGIINTPPAIGLGTSPRPTIFVGIQGIVLAPMTGATGAALAPTLQASASLQSPAADAVGAFPVPDIVPAPRGEVLAPVALAVGALPVPTIGASRAGQAIALPMRSVRSLPVPALISSSTLIAPVAAATGQFLAPTIHISADVTASIVPSTGTMLMPEMSIGEMVLVPAATALGFMVVQADAVSGNYFGSLTVQVTENQLERVFLHAGRGGGPG